MKFTWNMQTFYRYLWGTIPFPVETNCPHLERLPPFCTTVGHISVPGEFHGRGIDDAMRTGTAAGIYALRLLQPLLLGARAKGSPRSGRCTVSDWG